MPTCAYASPSDLSACLLQDLTDSVAVHLFTEMARPFSLPMVSCTLRGGLTSKQGFCVATCRLPSDVPPPITTTTDTHISFASLLGFATKVSAPGIGPYHDDAAALLVAIECADHAR
eukprot:6186521-Pleurochrysis_carterae.AAC.2